MPVESSTRRLSSGVERQGARVHARVWAPACRSVDMVVEAPRFTEPQLTPLSPDGDGYFAAHVDATAGDRYWFKLDGDRLRPDPASRYQPDGPHGPSLIVDPSRFHWTDGGWTGVSADGQVIYELHV